MKFVSFFLYGALSAAAAVAISWSVWSTRAVAQDAASPVAPALRVSDAAGSELKPALSNRAPQLTPAAPAQPAHSRTNPNSLLPTFAPYGTSTQAPAQAEPGTPIVQYGPTAGYPQYGPPPGQGYSQYMIRQAVPMVLPNPDRFTVELLKEYSAKQIEIDQLLRKRQEQKSESQWSELRQQIVEATAKQFDLRQQLREREIEQLKERLAEVESTVANRNKLKDEIVEKRVADILREPDQLQWESVGTGPASSFAPVTVTPTPVLTTRVPRTVVNYHLETIVDTDGNKTQVWKPAQETVYVDESVPRPPTVFNNVLPETSIPSQNSSVDPYAFLSQQQSATATLSVAEAKARVRIAESKRESMIRRVTNGDADRSEVDTLTAELDLAKVMLTQAQAEYEGRTKLLDLEVKRQESAFEHASAVLAETQTINLRTQNAIPSTQVATQKAAVEQARIEMERANAILEIHQKSNTPQEMLPGPSANGDK